MGYRAWHPEHGTWYGIQGVMMGDEYGIQAMGYRVWVTGISGYGHGAQSTFWGRTKLPPHPAPKSCEEQPQRTRPGLSALSLSDTLCPWHLPHEAADPLPHSGQGDAPQPSLTLPGAQRGLSGSESLLLLLLPPLSDSGLLWDGEPTSEGGGVSISITSAFTTSMGASALVPRLQWVPRSFAGSAGSRVS